MLNPTKKPGTEEDQASVEEARIAITNYTRIVERRLKPSLDAASALRDKAFLEIAELKQMSNALDIIDVQKGDKHHAEDLDESGKPAPALETRVNIGEEFYVRANIYDLDYVIVDVGLGVMVEMTTDEARAFVDERRPVLEEQANKHSTRISEIQAHLESITECLAELKLATGANEFFNIVSAAVDNESV